MIFLNFIRLALFFLFILPFAYTYALEESFLLINGKTDEIIMEFGAHIDERMSPCSTFKPTLSLMGYDAEILKDETNPTWDFKEEYDDWLVSWRLPHSPKSWMESSCLWYSKQLALQLGLENIENYLALFDYGNQDMSGGLANIKSENPAWIRSSLLISVREQVAFIQKMHQGKLPISDHAVYMTKAIVFKEELPNRWKLFGKTGWSGSYIGKDGKTLEHGWFVGWVEKDDTFYPFAYLLLDKKIDTHARIPRVKKLLIEGL